MFMLCACRIQYLETPALERCEIKLLIQCKIDQELFFESPGNLCPTYLSYHVNTWLNSNNEMKTFENCILNLACRNTIN